MLSAHLDTIPLGSALGSMILCRRGGRRQAHGRGASDTKAALRMVLAAIRMQRCQSANRAVLMLTGAEETGNGAERQRAELPEVGALVIGEPTSNYPMIGHKGALWLEVLIKGISAHGSMPELGDNAIYKAASAILQLRYFDFGIKPHPLLGMPTLNIGLIAGGLNINSVPDTATFKVDIRTIIGQKSDDLLEDLQDAIGKKAAMTVLLNRQPVYSDYSDVWIQEVFDAVENMTGQRPA